MCHKTREPHEALHAGGRRGLALYAVAAICVRLVTSRRRGDSVKACRQGSPHPELCMALSVLLAIVGCSSAKDSGAKRAYGTHPVIGHPPTLWSLCGLPRPWGTGISSSTLWPPSSPSFLHGYCFIELRRWRHRPGPLRFAWPLWR
ncbi:hypothetical protein M8818_004067 [Zalaria obscura]|uniref:Uncharacterized protein n=1 Tax=Zalaria obscura TaxID=2024903 RepID=A0ACC3SDR4_9PEZI